MERIRLTATVLAVLLGAVLACAGAAPAGAAPAGAAAPACVGDCAGDGMVTIEDLIIGVNIALGSRAVSACKAMDSDGGGTVTVDELIRAVDAALNGCPAEPTLTATATAPPSATPSTNPTATPTDTPLPSRTMCGAPTSGVPTSTRTLGPQTPVPTPLHFCDLPGSVQSTGPGVSVVPGGPADVPDLSFMHLPVGFCAHFFARVGNVRNLRFAPGGDLFVASPTNFTTSNGQGGQAAIIVLPDDDHDGVADGPTTFLSGLPSTRGLLFANGYLYYQNATKILRVPYAPGDRVASGPSEQVADVTIYTSSIHWPKAIDADDDGNIYVANGGDDPEQCNPDVRPFHGGILKLDGSPGAAPVAKGFRNPVSLRCAHGHNLCFAIELARDYSSEKGGREKLVPIHQGDDWGFPCCASKDLPYSDWSPTPDCSMVSAEIGSFVIGHTPFDLDFETGKWPEPWKHHVYVPLHGAYGNWEGASVVAIDFDAMTGQVLPGSDLPGAESGALTDFATGWADGTRSHGRPTVVTFAPDGRLFLGSDTNPIGECTGYIVWIAPLDLPTS